LDEFRKRKKDGFSRIHNGRIFYIEHSVTWEGLITNPLIKE